MTKKAKTTTHIVIPDTNILWNDDPAKIVSPGFDKFWNSFAKNNNLELYIPEVVKGELLYQLTKPAFNSISDITKSINNISKITDKKHRFNITHTKTKELVSKRFEKWLNVKKGACIPTPINNINWNNIVNSAIWRKPPFEDTKKGRSIEEKGFRDSMILETIIDLCKHNKSNKISFISSDKTFKDSTDIALKKSLTYSSYESINDFQSYLNLLNEELENQFVKDILGKANSKFFTANKKDTYYYREKIWDSIIDKYGNYMLEPSKSESITELLPDNTRNTWELTNNMRLWVHNAEFIKKTENTYYWRNRIEYCREFSKKNLGGLLSNLDECRETILVVPVYINWNCIVSSNKRFSNFILDDFAIEGNFFCEMTDELRKKYLNG